MKKIRVKFPGSQGFFLSSEIDLPDEGKPIAYSLFAHCFTCNKNYKAVGNIANALTNAGIGLMRFDFTGLGESEGEFSETNFSSNISDLIKASKYLEENHEAPKLLIGHSLGGSAVILASERIPSAKAVATIASPFQINYLSRLVRGKEEEMRRTGMISVNIGGKNFKLFKSFFDDLNKYNMSDKINSLKKALCVFHSPVDRTVDLSEAEMIFRSAKHPKSYISLDQADHLLSNSEDSNFAGRLIAVWSEKYITS